MNTGTYGGIVMPTTEPPEIFKKFHVLLQLKRAVRFEWLLLPRVACTVCGTRAYRWVSDTRPMTNHQYRN